MKLKFFTNRKQLVIIISSLLLFAACKKDANEPSSPQAEPLTGVEVRPGDTLIIKGKNFSEVLTSNIVKFNGVEATLISASPTELKVLVPAGATSGAITITITVNGVTIEPGSVTIVTYTLYAIKSTSQPPNSPIYQLVSIDPVNGRETLITTLTERLFRIVYLASTNEVVGTGYNGYDLFKINVTTKQTTSVGFAPGGFHYELVVDKYANLYTINRGYDGNQTTYTLVKVDPETGTTTSVTPIAAHDLVHLVYLEASNEVAAVVDGGSLVKVNLTTKKATYTKSSNSSDIQFLGLAADNQSNLYSLKYSVVQSKAVYQIVKLNDAPDAETVLSTLPGPSNRPDFVFIPQRNEIASVWNDNHFYQFNISTKANATKQLSTEKGVQYLELAIK